MSQFHQQLDTYTALLQQQRDQIVPALEQLHQQIDQRLRSLQQQELDMLAAQRRVLKQMKASIAADARCLLVTEPFRLALPALLENRRISGLRSISEITITTDPTSWVLPTLSLPLEIVSYETSVDETAYNDAEYYTDYLYRLVAQLGEWEETICISAAILTPGNPMFYHVRSLSTQFHMLLHQLRYEASPDPEATRPEFPDLQLANAQTLQLKQEISCLLAFLGNICHIHSRVDTFRYPQTCGS